MGWGPGVAGCDFWKDDQRSAEKQSKNNKKYIRREFCFGRWVIFFGCLIRTWVDCMEQISCFSRPDLAKILNGSSKDAEGAFCMDSVA